MNNNIELCKHGRNEGHCEKCGTTVCVDCAVFMMDVSELIICYDCAEELGVS